MTSKPSVRVVWDDAEDSDAGKSWLDEGEVEQFSQTVTLVVSYGILLRKTPKYLTIVGDWIPRLEQYGRVTKIPTSQVRELVVWEESPAAPPDDSPGKERPSEPGLPFE